MWRTSSLISFKRRTMMWKKPKEGLCTSTKSISSRVNRVIPRLPGTSPAVREGGGAFGGLEDIIRKRAGRKRMGFGGELAERGGRRTSELLHEVRPEDLLKF